MLPMSLNEATSAFIADRVMSHALFDLNAKTIILLFLLLTNIICINCEQHS